MKAIRFHGFGDASVLRYEEVGTLEPGAGEVRVAVAATSFNGIDAGIRGGGMQGPFPVALPHIPGIDVAGTVDAVGPGVVGLAIGDAVIGFLPMVADGAAAQQVLAPADALVPAPTRISLEDAAAIPTVGLTAWQALFDHAGLRVGQRVLINGAGGAVGSFAVQLAANAGAVVIATAGPRSATRVASAGAAQVIDRTEGPVSEASIEPVDVLVNLAPIDPGELAALARRVRDGGVIVSTTVWMPAPSDDARGVRGIDLFLRSDADELRRLVGLVDDGALRVDVAEHVRLEDLPAVHARAASGGISGKVVVVVPQD